KRKVWGVVERPDADPQPTNRPASHHHDRQRSGARYRGRHLRQAWPGRSGWRRPADAAYGANYVRRNGRMTINLDAAVAKARSWGTQLLQFLAAILTVFLAKG